MKIIEEIVKNTDMGVKAINNIRTYVEDEELMHKMLCQREELKKIQQEAEHGMGQEEIKNSKANKFQEWMLKMGVRFNAMTDKSNQNIAEMMIEGTNMGINSIQKVINEMNRSGEEVPAIANNLMTVYNNNITELRSYL